jgi:hypothetical protein
MNIDMYTITNDAGLIHRNEYVRISAALNMILVDSRLNGQWIFDRSKSLMISLLLENIVRCTQERVLCTYDDVKLIFYTSLTYSIKYHYLRWKSCVSISMSMIF